MLWYGNALRRWILEGGPPARLKAGTGRVRALAFDACAAMQQALPSPPLSAPPIIVTGLWRTGTTLLHEMLAAIEGLTAPTTWQCLRPASFRLEPKPAERHAVRPMDGLAVSTVSPQEDEFALLLLGAPSLYRGFLDPRRLAELGALLDRADDPGFHQPWMRFLAAVQAEGGGRLLLKSPNHLFRLEAVRAVFPGAPIIVTLRDPAPAWWSNIRMWTEMAALHGHWPAEPSQIEAFVARAMAAAARALNALADAPGMPAAVVPFERLVADPAAETLRLADRLGLHVPQQGRAAIAAAARARAGHRAGTSPAPLPPAAVEAAAALAHANGRLLRRFG